MSKTPEKEFEQELECFRREIETGIHALFAYLSIHTTAKNRPSIQNKLNATPHFWTTVLYSLQSTQFIALGRIFDNNSPHNVYRLLKLVRENSDIFSKEALAARKHAGSDNADEWLPKYLKTVHEPDTTDFRRLRQHVSRRKKRTTMRTGIFGTKYLRTEKLQIMRRFRRSSKKLRLTSSKRYSSSYRNFIKPCGSSTTTGKSRS